MPLFILSCALCLVPVIGHTAEITLAWDPNEEPDIAGYAIYHNIDYSGPPYGYSGDVLIEDLEDPDRPKATITELEENTTYCFAITAFDDDGNESDYSDEVCVQINGDSITVLENQGNADSGGGGGGGGCFIASSAQKQSSFEAKDFFQFLPFLYLLIIGIFIRH